MEQTEERESTVEADQSAKVGVSDVVSSRRGRAVRRSGSTRLAQPEGGQIVTWEELGGLTPSPVTYPLWMGCCGNAPSHLVVARLGAAKIDSPMEDSQ